MVATIPDSVLALHDVSYSYGQTQALHNVDLSVSPGEIVILAGRNGAGKSTLLRCAAGWTEPTKGRVEILGNPLRESDRALRRELVLVTDTPPFYDDLTGREHLMFVLRANKLEEHLDEGESLLSDFGLHDAADAYPSTYSRGMRYKLALVLALAVRPSLLLLDEPFGPIDAASARELWRVLRERTAEGSSVLLSAHQLPENVVADRTYVLESGTVIESHAPGDSDHVA